MKPPICDACGRAFDPSEEGGLVGTGPGSDPGSKPESGADEGERRGPPTGHPPGVSWYCGDHLEEARRREEGTAEESREGPSGGAEGGSRRWAWAVLLLVVVGLVARQWGDRIEEEEREETFRAAGGVAAAVYLDRLRAAAPPGTPAADYAEAAVRALPGWTSRWRSPPLVHRISQPLLMGTPTLEVVIRDGRVDTVRTANAPPVGDEIEADSAAVLLGLPPRLGIFSRSLPSPPGSPGDDGGNGPGGPVGGDPPP